MDGAHLPDAWRDLYLMLGTSSAALIGLLFVASTLHVREIVSVEMFKVRVQNTMLVMVGTLIQATAILTPQPLRFLGAELLILNLWGLWFPLSLLYKATRMSAARARRFLVLSRDIFHHRLSDRHRRDDRAHRRRRLGPLSGDHQLHAFPCRRHLECLDDDAGNRTRRRKTQALNRREHVQWTSSSRARPRW